MTLPEGNCETRPEGKTGAERPRSGDAKHEEATPPPTRKRSSSDPGSDGTSPRTSCEADADDGLAKLEALFLCAVVESRRTGTAQVLQCKDANEADQVFEFDGDGGGRVKRLRVGSQVSILQVPGKRHGAAQAYCTFSCGSWVRSNKINKTIGCLGDAKAGRRQDGRGYDPDVLLVPKRSAPREGKLCPRFIAEIETRNRRPLEMREQYWHYFQDEHGSYLQGMLGVKIWEEGNRPEWQAAAVFWQREEPDQAPTVLRAIDFGPSELQETHKRAFSVERPDTLAPVQEAQWERFQFLAPVSPGEASTASRVAPSSGGDDESPAASVNTAGAAAEPEPKPPPCVIEIRAPVILYRTGLDLETVPSLFLDLHGLLGEVWEYEEEE